jgi:hypothetical protein
MIKNVLYEYLQRKDLIKSSLDILYNMIHHPKQLRKVI